MNQSSRLWLTTPALVIIFSCTNILTAAYVVPTGTLTCFSRPLGGETKLCKMIHGFRSCYTKYNMRGQVLARGCSTMQPTFNKCETHKYGQFKSDKYCYCKETFCNHQPAVLPNIYCLGEQQQPTRV